MKTDYKKLAEEYLDQRKHSIEAGDWILDFAQFLESQEEKEAPKEICDHIPTKEYPNCPMCYKFPNNIVESWEEKLSEKFDFMIDRGIEDKLWTEQERVAFKFVEATIRKLITDTLASSRSKVREMIEGMKTERAVVLGGAMSFEQQFQDGLAIGYNQALSDLLEKFKK